MADTLKITFERYDDSEPPAVTETVVIDVPAEIVTMLDALSANVTIPDPDNPGSTINRYGSSVSSVIWTDVMDILMRSWKTAYAGIAGASYDASRISAQLAALADVDTGIAGIVITGP